jgi:hypothetical protein
MFGVQCCVKPPLARRGAGIGLQRLYRSMHVSSDASILPDEPASTAQNRTAPEDAVRP